MGNATCPRCGQAVQVPRPEQTWQCPNCGAWANQRMWQKVGAVITGGSLVVTGVVLIAFMWAVLASCA